MRLPWKAAGLTLLALLAGSSLVSWDRLYVNGLWRILNDQVGYISVARNLAESGRLESNVIYPSVLAQAARRNTLYMPGHYWALAAVFKTLGYSVRNSFLPSLLGYALGGLLIAFAADALYGSTAAVFACVLFLFFPLNLIFAFTAMAELDLTAAALAAFAAFLALSPRRRAWWGPLLLVPPLLFRETGAALAAVMLPLVFFERRDGKQAAAFAFLSGVVVVLVLLSPASAGRPSLWGANILFRGRAEAIYSQAFAVQAAHAAPADWLAAVARNVAANARDLLLPDFAGHTPDPAEYLHLLFILSGIPLGLRLWRRRGDAYGLGVAGMVALMLALDFAFYVVWNFRGVKSLLVCQPFVAILWAGCAARALERRPERLRAAAAAAALWIVAGTACAYAAFRFQKQVDDAAERDTAFIESLAGAGTPGILVSPWQLSLDYVNKHPEVVWSFPPADAATWDLLNRLYPIGTLIMPSTPRTAGDLAAEAARLGLVPAGEKTYRGLLFKAYRRKAEGGEGASK